MVILLLSLLSVLLGCIIGRDTHLATTDFHHFYFVYFIHFSSKLVIPLVLFYFIATSKLLAHDFSFVFLSGLCS